MKVYVRRIKGVVGVSSDIWAVYVNGGLVKLLPTKSEAQHFAADIANGRMEQ